MGKQKPGTMIYWEMFDVLERLSPEKVKAAIKAIREYSQRGIEPLFDSDESLAVVWPLFAQKIAADNERYAKRCEQAKAAINSRWGNAGNTNVYERIPNIPTTTTTETSSSSTSSVPTMTAATKDNILKYAKQCGFNMNMGTMHEIMRLVSQYGNDRVFQALDRCVEYGKTSIAYLTTVLQNL